MYYILCNIKNNPQKPYWVCSKTANSTWCTLNEITATTLCYNSTVNIEKLQEEGHMLITTIKDYRKFNSTNYPELLI